MTLLMRSDPVTNRLVTVQVTFADAVAAATGLTIDQVWETEQVQALLSGADLLWHSVEELDRFGKDDRHA